VSLAAGLGAGYVHSILNEGKDPTIDNLIAVCNEIGVSLSAVLYGYEMSAENEEILRLLQNSSPGAREGLLALLREKRGV
jgi:ribonucleoside-diphosphate reductase alpha chain